MHDLLTRMAGDLALAQGTNERAADYERRVLWSALGRMMTADEDDLALTVNGKNRKLRLGDFRQAADSMRFTPVQFARSLKRVTSAVRAHLDEALARSFLSDDFKLRLGKLVAAHLKVLEDA